MRKRRRLQNERSFMMENLENKQNKGQFYTVTNPFKLNPVYTWYDAIPNMAEETILEPFAGSNNIIKMIQEINVAQPAGWQAYDIEPPTINKTPEYPVEERDTLANFPSGYRVGITNPPYLARNSATRRGLDYPDTEHDDKYKEAIEQMLIHLDYVAAIIPESFITSGLFTDRLDKVISLNVKMFEDTETPVCLALFNKEHMEETEVYRMNLLLGTLSDLREELKYIHDHKSDIGNQLEFNSPDGSIGLRLVDNTKEDSIVFFEGENIDPSKVKNTSRANTRVAGLDFETDADRQKFLEVANELLATYREKTQDVFMTSFKGLRADGKYRRRLDFKTARAILAKAYELTMGVNIKKRR